MGDMVAALYCKVFLAKAAQTKKLCLRSLAGPEELQILLSSLPHYVVLATVNFWGRPAATTDADLQGFLEQLADMFLEGGASQLEEVRFTRMGTITSPPPWPPRRGEERFPKALTRSKIEQKQVQPWLSAW